MPLMPIVPGARRMRIAVAAVAVLFVAPAVQGQWTARYLDRGPGGGDSSAAYGVRDGQVVGALFSNQPGKPPITYSTPMSWETNTNALAIVPGLGAMYGVDGGRQVGLFNGRATMWSGAPETAVDLHPTGALASTALGIHGDTQVGETVFEVGGVSQHTYASAWHGTAESWVNLHPATATASSARAAYGDRQVGYVITSGAGHAAMWSGSAETVVDLNPAGAIQSLALAVYGDEQGGAAKFGPSQALRAGIWHGSAASWIDLRPIGSSESAVLGVFGGFQVGYATFAGVRHAGVWRGTAESWVDLSGTLSASGASTATGVWSDGQTLYVSGWGADAFYWPQGPGRSAVLWTSPIPAPGAGAVLGIGALCGARRRRDRRGVRRREGDRRRARVRFGLVEGVHAPADVHRELRHEPAAGAGRTVPVSEGCSRPFGKPVA